MIIENCSYRPKLFALHAPTHRTAALYWLCFCHISRLSHNSLLSVMVRRVSISWSKIVRPPTNQCAIQQSYSALQRASDRPKRATYCVGYIRSWSVYGRPTQQLEFRCSSSGHRQCSRIRILCFFFRFQKNMTFYVFLK